MNLHGPFSLKRLNVTWFRASSRAASSRLSDMKPWTDKGEISASAMMESVSSSVSSVSGPEALLHLLALTVIYRGRIDEERTNNNEMIRRKTPRSLVMAAGWVLTGTGPFVMRLSEPETRGHGRNGARCLGPVSSLSAVFSHSCQSYLTANRRVCWI